MDELDLTEKTPRTFDEDDLGNEASPAISVTPARTARGTKSHTALPSAPPPIPRPRAGTVKPLVPGTITAAPAKLIPFLPPPEPQSPMPGSFPVVRSPSATAPPPTPRASTGTLPPPTARRATTVSPHVVPRKTAGNIAIPRTTTPGYDPAGVGGRSTIDLARGSMAPREMAMSGPRPDEVEIPIEIAADAPHVATPMTDGKHVALPPMEAREVADDIDRSSARPKRNVAVIVGVAAGATLVSIAVALVVRGSGPRPAPAPVPAALASVPDPGPSRATAPVEAPPAPPAVEVAATTSAAAAAPVEPSDDEPARVDLPITSQPDGAIVTLIANGDATVVGRTPITASVDPTLTYDVVFALKDHPTMIAHVDASKVHELALDLSPRAAPVRRRTKVPPPAKAAETRTKSR